MSAQSAREGAPPRSSIDQAITLENVVRQAQQRPLAADLLEAAEKKLTEATSMPVPRVECCRQIGEGMRTTSLAITVLALALLGLETRAAPTSAKVSLSAQSDRRLTSAHQAICGGHRTAAVKSLVAKGTSEQLNVATGSSSKPALWELKMLLPDNYAEIVTDMLFVRQTGFRGDALLEKWTPVSPGSVMRRSGGASPDAMKRVRRRFARLVLGILAETETALSLRTIPGVQNGIALEGPDSFHAVLELDHRTGMPVRVRYQDDVRLPTKGDPNGQRSLTTASSGTTEREVTMTFDERRVVDGFALPHRIVRSVGDIVLEDIRIRRFTLNEPIDPQEFER